MRVEKVGDITVVEDDPCVEFWQDVFLSYIGKGGVGTEPQRQEYAAKWATEAVRHFEQFLLKHKESK